MFNKKQLEIIKNNSHHTIYNLLDIVYMLKKDDEIKTMINDEIKTHKEIIKICIKTIGKNEQRRKVR